MKKITVEDLIEKAKYWFYNELMEGEDVDVIIEAYMKAKDIKEEDIVE